MTLIHSSHDWKIESVTNSAQMIKSPEITAVCVAVESGSKRRAHGEIHNQIPSSQLHQSSHCLGSENSTAAIAHRPPKHSRHLCPFFPSQRTFWQLKCLEGREPDNI